MNNVHGCQSCGEVMQGYSLDQDGYKVCSACGGHVLNLQEAFDMIISLKIENEELSESLLGGSMFHEW